LRTIECATCGKTFTVTRGGRCTYCSDECRKQAKAKYHKGYLKDLYNGSHRAWENQKASAMVEEKARKERKKNMEEINRVRGEADALGMSYGKYVAMKWMRGERA
jgi:ribosomal protein L20